MLLSIVGSDCLTIDELEDLEKDSSLWTCGEIARIQLDLCSIFAAVVMQG